MHRSDTRNRHSDMMIYLASASPRRQELLRQIDVPFEAMPSRIEEQRRPGERPDDYGLRVATDKARHVAARVMERGLPARPVLGADTEVVLDDEVFGKPRDTAEAAAMLSRLAGKPHEVISGLCLIAGGGEHRVVSRSRVTFAPMSRAEVDDYCQTGEPLDKAGGYAIQGRAAAYIERLEGSYSGVMGLPLHELATVLRKAGLR